MQQENQKIAPTKFHPGERKHFYFLLLSCTYHKALPIDSCRISNCSNNPSGGAGALGCAHQGLTQSGLVSPPTYLSFPQLGVGGNQCQEKVKDSP